MITNDAGQAAMVYYQPIPKLIELSSIKSYYFDVKYGVSLAWVDPTDVDTLLSIKGGCCGGQRQVVYPANENQFKMFSTGDYR